jgi:hypothetical protein
MGLSENSVPKNSVPYYHCRFGGIPPILGQKQWVKLFEARKNKDTAHRF